MSSETDSLTTSLTRRSFLKGAGATALFFVLTDGAMDVAAQQAAAHAAAPAASAETLAGFYRVSVILTGAHPIEQIVSDQAWLALCARYDDFAQRFGQLQQAMAQDNFTDIESFKGSRLQEDDGLRRTTMEIISAWYLGKVGEVKGESQTGGPEYVTYVDALLWQPTLHPGIIPSYSHGSPGWWGRLSATDLKV